MVGDAGVYFSSGQPTELAVAIRGLMQSPETRIMLSQRSRIRARAFTLRDCLLGYESLYRSVLLAATERV